MVYLLIFSNISLSKVQVTTSSM